MKPSSYHGHGLSPLVIPILHWDWVGSRFSSYAVPRDNSCTIAMISPPQSCHHKVKKWTAERSNVAFPFQGRVLGQPGLVRLFSRHYSFRYTPLPRVWGPIQRIECLYLPDPKTNTCWILTTSLFPFYFRDFSARKF